MSNILILEPDNNLGHLYSKSLGVKHSIHICKMAEEAIAKLDEISIDLVITELQISLHNGMEFIYEMRSYLEWERIPIIILSHVSPKLLEKYDVLQKQLHIADYLYKPATKLAKLNQIVEQHLP